MKRIMLLLILLTGCIQNWPINLLETPMPINYGPDLPSGYTRIRTLNQSDNFSEQVAAVQKEYDERFSNKESAINIRLEGTVHLPKNTTKTLSKWYNTSIDKRSVEWGVCFYGQSYEVSQNFTGYYPTIMVEAKSKNAEAKEVLLTCDLNYDGESFIGTAHIHHNNNILPSFLDTTTWAHLPGRERKFHCVFIDDMSINCYSWKGYPILMN